MNQNESIQVNEFTILKYTSTKSKDGGYFSLVTTDTDECIDISIEGMKNIMEFVENKGLLLRSI